MKIQTFYNQTVIFTLVITLFLNTTAGLKRVPVPLDSHEVRINDTIMVFLKSGIKHELNRPKFEDDYLVGINRNKQIKIPLDDIESLEIIRFDRKKIIKGVIFTSLAIFTLFVIGLGLGLRDWPEENPPLE